MFRYLRTIQSCSLRLPSPRCTRWFRFDLNDRALKITSDISLTVIGTSNCETSPALLLCSDQKSFLFNCGENINRAFLQHQKSFNSKHILLTGNTWEHIGGLGMVISRTGSDIRRFGEGYHDTVTVHMPAKLNIFKNLCDINKAGHVRQSFLEPGMIVHDDPNLNLKVLNISTLKSKPDATYAAYICEVKSLPGKFDGPKADLLGLTKSQRNLLLEGESLTIDNGIIVEPKDIIGPRRNGQVFCVIDCPSLEVMEDLIQQKDVVNFQIKNAEKKTLVVHITPQHVFKDPSYSRFMEMFGETDHLLFNKEVCPKEVILKTSFLNAQKMHRYHPYIFPLLCMRQQKESEEKLPKNVIPASSQLKYIFRPLRWQGYNFDEIKKISLKWKKIVTNNNRPKRPVAKHNSTIVKPEIVFLGTCGTTSSAYRNVSSILVHLSSKKYVLLDCGEGTLTQLEHHFGAEMDDVISNIKCIFISHTHEDHIMGLPSLVMHRQNLYSKEADSEPITIVGPGHLQNFLENFSATVQELNFRFENSYSENEAEVNHKPQIASVLGISKFKLVLVHHIFGTYGLILENEHPEWKIVYSADTRPCQRLITEGKDATLLIHEATYDDKDRDYAIARKHSTMTEAINVGRKMNANHVILTHIGLRNSALSLPSYHHSRACQAFDHMQVQLDNLQDLVRVSRAVNYVFANENSYEKKRTKKQLQRKNNQRNVRL